MVPANTPHASPPSEEEILGYLTSLSNWGRWGDSDARGTLNFITNDVRARAGQLISSGEVVSCSWDIVPNVSEPHDVGVGPPMRLMVHTGQGLADENKVPPVVDFGKMATASDYIGLYYHGFRVTHMDALSHIFWDRKMYNGRPAELVASGPGATELDIVAAAEGVVSRGILIDVPRFRDIPWLGPGEALHVDELQAIISGTGVEPRSGDILLLRTGYARKRIDEGPGSPSADGRPGWHASCLPWLHEHEVAAIGADTAQDVRPSYDGKTDYPNIKTPVHAVGITAMGMHLMDNCNLERLAEACSRHERWEFFFSAAPLRLARTTGSPLNPLAVF